MNEDDYYPVYLCRKCMKRFPNCVAEHNNYECSSCNGELKKLEGEKEWVEQIYFNRDNPCVVDRFKECKNNNKCEICIIMDEFIKEIKEKESVF